ncbi:MAG TPA: histidine phosphatase family protein [Candidatus Limnocylindria bacterium]|nr:histidine phosphatase family protein [Candidatus Limnocylindria bacterium]
MIIYLLRHGDAGDPRPHNDDARELSDKGRTRLHNAAGLWRRLRVAPEVVISSPLPRAHQTAELLVSGLGLSLEIAVDDRLRPGADWTDLAAAMADHGPAERVALVGHDPDLSDALAGLSGSSLIGLRKGAMACLEFAGKPGAGRGRLRWLLDPDLYRDDPQHG